MNYIADILRDISELVKLPTVYDPDTVTDGMPYGRAVALGYQWIREKALSDGFEVLEYDGHALAIRIKGSEIPHRIDVVSHVDVVAPGGGWELDPFSGSVTEDGIYGRGTVDMKGTLILTYYALKYIKENRIPCNRELRLVIGCDEERTMQDMKYYIKKAGPPDFAFTPDGKFPYSLGEKGALMWTLEGEMSTCIEEFDGGVQCNVVSPIAKAKLKGTAYAERLREELRKYQYNTEVSCDGEATWIVLEGKAAHASVPQEGFNATVHLLRLIALVTGDPLAELLYRSFGDYYGKGVGLEYDIAPMGKLTINLGVLKIRKGKLVAQIDCRYPKGINSDLLTKKLQEVLVPIRVIINYDDEPTLADADSPFFRYFCPHTVN
jgi:succinyl-diaminopimelate desuccinylase